MKRQYIFLLIISILINFYSPSYAKDKGKDLNLTAETAVLVDALSGDILYEKDIDKQMYPASTTKILTAIIAIENSSLDQKVVIDEETVKTSDGSSIGLIEGEVFSMNDLLHALLISSANDSAVAIAKAISGSVDDFSVLMNKEASRMGAKNSNFTNPSGLPDEQHVSTAYDLSQIALYAMKNEVFSEIVKKSIYTIEATNKKPEARKLRNSNKMLYSDIKIDVDGREVPIKYDGVEGIKTGYTKAANQCLVSGVKKADGRFISVVLKSVQKDVYVDTHKLFNYASGNKKVVLAKRNEFIDNINVRGGDPDSVTAVVKSDFTINETGEDLDHVRREVKIDPLSLPIKSGDTLGKVMFKIKDKSLGSVELVAASGVSKRVKDASTLFVSLLDKWWFWLIVSIILLRVLVAIRNFTFRALRLRASRRKKKARELRKKRQTSN